MKTTNAHFTLFREEVKEWMSRFHLGSWRVVCYHEQPDASGRADCNVICYPTDRYAEMRMATEMNVICDRWIAYCAFHETCHILLEPIAEPLALGFDRQSVSLGRESHNPDVTTHVHMVINILARLLFDPYWEVREREMKKVRPSHSRRKRG